MSCCNSCIIFMFFFFFYWWHVKSTFSFLKSFEGEHSNLDMCKYHPGVPIFHEGLKYWSCCQKKTTDFTEFLEQLGCSTGHHCWINLVSKHSNFMSDIDIVAWERVIKFLYVNWGSIRSFIEVEFPIEVPVVFRIN